MKYKSDFLSRLLTKTEIILCYKNSLCYPFARIFFEQRQENFLGEVVLFYWKKKQTHEVKLRDRERRNCNVCFSLATRKWLWIFQSEATNCIMHSIENIFRLVLFSSRGSGRHRWIFFSSPASVETEVLFFSPSIMIFINSMIMVGSYFVQTLFIKREYLLCYLYRLCPKAKSYMSF